MPTIFSATMTGQQTGIGYVVVNDENALRTKEPMDIKASIFFDGTYNNRANVKLARANPGAETVVHGTEQVRVGGGRGVPSRLVTRPRVVKVDAATYNDRTYSNIATMDTMNDIQDAETQLSVYVEGIGTVDYGPANNVGGATGAGATGIPAKVTLGITRLAADVQRLLQAKGKRLGKLKVDVYGFSRGAAAARHFVARRTGQFFPKENDLAGTLSVPATAIVINFVGLYDTVSSYGAIGWNTLVTDLFQPFRDDVKQLRLNIGSTAKRVVQLASGDEYRALFSSTTIDSSVNAGVGYQCTIPGDHADVGGSYKATAVETPVNVTKAERDELVRNGWFTAAQMPDPGPPVAVYTPDMGTMYVPATTKGTRTVKGQYQSIPLSLMMALAKKEGATFKPFSQEFAEYKVPAPLAPLHALMRASVVDRQEKRFDVPADMHWVRNQYLHISATPITSFGTIGIGFPNREDGKVKRHIISDAA